MIDYRRLSEKCAAVVARKRDRSLSFRAFKRDQFRLRREKDQVPAFVSPSSASRCRQNSWLVEIHPALDYHDIVGFRVRFCSREQPFPLMRCPLNECFRLPRKRMINKKNEEIHRARSLALLCRISPRHAGGFTLDERGHKLAVTPRRRRKRCPVSR